MVHRFRIVAPATAEPGLLDKTRESPTPWIPGKLFCGKVSQKQCQTAKLATEMLQLILNIKAVRVFRNHDKLVLNVSYS